MSDRDGRCESERASGGEGTQREQKIEKVRAELWNVKKKITNSPNKTPRGIIRITIAYDRELAILQIPGCWGLLRLR
jgi:hypothetical protein